MHVAILRRVPKFSISMDVHADGLVSGLKAVRPDWTITQHCPQPHSQRKVLKPLAGIGKYAERYWQYPNRLSQVDADIFHIIDHSDGHLCARLQKEQKPNVVTCHDLINLVQPETFKGKAIFPWLSMTLWQRAVRSMKWADHVITVSAHTKQDTVRHLNIASEGVTVVHNAVDSRFRVLSAECRVSTRARYGLSAEHFCLFNVGSNNARKNISGILVAIATLKESGLPVHFWKAGANFSSEQKAFIQAHGLGSCVSYIGQPGEEELVALYNAADCLMAPSLYEGFGFTILEAMACGTPVITANASAMPEVAGDAAILVNPQDIEAIAQAVLTLYNHQNKAQDLAKRGLARANDFSWEKAAEQTAQVYEQVLAKNKEANQ